MRRVRLPSVHVRGVGRVRVTRLPTKIPKTVFGKPIKKRDYLAAWALSHQPDMMDKNKFSQFLKERIAEKGKTVRLSPFEKYEQDVEFAFGRPIHSEDVMYHFERGDTVEQAVSALRPHEEVKKRGED
jgi:hypothetical protein